MRSRHVCLSTSLIKYYCMYFDLLLGCARAAEVRLLLSSVRLHSSALPCAVRDVRPCGTASINLQRVERVLTLLHARAAEPVGAEGPALVADPVDQLCVPSGGCEPVRCSAV